MAFVVLIQSNPEISHRPCEGIRIALGLAAGGHEVTVILSGDAARLLSPDVEELVDGDLTVKFLEGLKEFIPAFHVREDSGIDLGSPPSPYTISLISDDAISEKIATANHFACF